MKLAKASPKPPKASPRLPNASPKLRVTDLNLKKTAQRLLGQNLVATESDYVKRELGLSATQQEIDDNVLAVRRLPWASIVAPD